MGLFTNPSQNQHVHPPMRSATPSTHAENKKRSNSTSRRTSGPKSRLSSSQGQPHHIQASKALSHQRTRPAPYPAHLVPYPSELSRPVTSPDLRLDPLKLPICFSTLSDVFTYCPMFFLPSALLPASPTFSPHPPSSSHTSAHFPAPPPPFPHLRRLSYVLRRFP
jgi:hypothetical protein